MTLGFRIIALLSPRLSRRRAWLVAGLLAGAMTLAPAAAGAANTPPAVVMTDSAIARAVEKELLVDPGVSSHLVDVSVAEGIVSLTGTVASLAERERAVRLARTIRGVRSVVDRIDVRTAPRPDADIRADIEKALARDPATDAYEVQVAVRNGVATLTGEVDSWQEMQLSETVAKGVRGVREIINHVVWKGTSDRKDTEIRADIQRRLQDDVWVDASNITVEVNQGKAKLTGRTGSAHERSRAMSDAWVAGVTQVDANGLSVDPALLDTRRQLSPAHADRTDAQIAEAVRHAFLYDPRVYSFNPTVQVENGIVTLSGVVDSVRAKKAAENDARNTVGVMHVVNLLKVRPTTAITDADLAREIREALAASPFVDRYDVEVRVENGKAFLSGRADTLFERAEAVRIAEGVSGVADVRNNIDVPARMTSHPVVAPGISYVPYYDPPVWSATTLEPDTRLQREIEAQLFWSPWVDSDHITVTVDEGIATLRGTVQSRMERGAAIDNAYQGGALAVRDELRLVRSPSS